MHSYHDVEQLWAQPLGHSHVLSYDCVADDNEAQQAWGTGRDRYFDLFLKLAGSHHYYWSCNPIIITLKVPAA
jgi:hypothetical protein